MVPGVPFVHGLEYVFGVVDRYDGALGEDVQLRVRDDGRYFQDDVLFGVESGHFEVHPDEIAGTFLLCHIECKFSFCDYGSKNAFFSFMRFVRLFVFFIARTAQ